MWRVSAAPEREASRAGAVIAERYRLEALVGEGGMGSVWRARHLQLDSDVALKLMSPAIAAQPDALQRFLREARAAARLNSLHVVKVFDYGVDAGTPFIAMELLAGESLRQRLDREGPQSPVRTLWVVRHAARALAKAHAEGIVHRDLKPENLFIAQQEEELVKVLDFGVAKLAGSTPAAPSMSTRTGAVLGTPYYMSPEQVRGIKALDHRSDLWSLAVITFECLTGRLPFDGEAFGDLVLKICTLPAPQPSALAAVPPGFDAWFARAVEREPEARFQSADELLAALEAALGEAAPSGPRSLLGAPLARAAGAAPVSAVAPSGVGAAEPLGTTHIGVTASSADAARIPKHGLGGVGLGVIGVLLLAGAGAWFWGSGQPPAPGAAPEVPSAASAPAVASPAAAPTPAIPAAPAESPAQTAAAAAPAAAEREPPQLRVVPVTASPRPTPAKVSPRASRPRPRSEPVRPTTAPSAPKSSRDLFSDPD